MDRLERLREKAKDLRNIPGVYIMRDVNNEVIYCGKALSLKKRVSSYFTKTYSLDKRKTKLVSEVEDFEYIVTGSEFEALILESNLIKKFRPRFNILLRDDKQYPHLCITITDPFPRLKIVRGIKRDKNLYFGPFTPVKAMRKTLKLIHEIFPVRYCSDVNIQNRKRPCINFQMGLCSAPCSGRISKEEYKKLIVEIILFLKGKKDSLIKKFKREMGKASDEQRFEEAARIRDQISAVLSCMEKQHVFDPTLKSQDYFAFVRGHEMVYVQVFFVRYGRMTGRKTLQVQGVQDIQDNELMGIVLKQFYGDDMGVPPEILVQTLPSELALIERWLSEKRGSNVKIIMPRRGRKKELMQIAKKNASLSSVTTSMDPGHTSEMHREILEQVQLDLSLPVLPTKIEGFDISNLGPTEAVGSMVFWEDASPVKSKYRRYRIKDIKGIDDYGMMEQVIGRRYSRLINENGDLPDLILIDGGKGHLNAGLKALNNLGIKGIPIVSLAKREELVHTPDSDVPINLQRRSPTLRLLQRIRDEAHRFALSYQKVRRKKRAFKSAFDDIMGVGPKRKEALLKHFHGLDGIRRASIEELNSIPEIDQKTAERIYEHFHKISDHLNT